MSNERSPSPDERLQQEFNRWAEQGEGPKMENHHLDITEKTMRRMELRPGERILDLGCGSGWATRLLARVVGEGPQGFGQVVGIDISDEMIRQARAASKEHRPDHRLRCRIHTVHGRNVERAAGAPQGPAGLAGSSPGLAWSSIIGQDWLAAAV